MPEHPYVPIACSFHDRLEHHTVRAEAVMLEVERHGSTETFRARILDVFARRDSGSDADFVRISPEDGEAFEVRADAILSVGGIRRDTNC